MVKFSEEPYQPAPEPTEKEIEKDRGFAWTHERGGGKGAGAIKVPNGSETTAKKVEGSP